VEEQEQADTRGVFSAVMSDGDFARISEFLHKEYGINLPAAKKQMLEGRLRRRLQRLRIGTFAEYCDYLMSSRGVEHEHHHMIDVVTTHKTDFFREPAHFEYLVQEAMPELVRNFGSGLQSPMVCWSAGCSTGEEPYTLAMVLSEFGVRYPGFRFRFSIIATDISTQVLETAEQAVYDEEKIEPVPLLLRRKYLLRSKDASLGLVRISPELCENVRFRCLNLVASDFGFREPLDFVFCRNVIIYFDRERQTRVLSRMCRCLRPGGYLFLGHSETVAGRDLPISQVAPTVYRKSH
jgi:chemotaxis protein methyltransferase CheR